MLFFLLIPTDHLPIYKDTKNFNEFFYIYGWSINPGIWLDSRICCDNLRAKNVWQLFFLFIFHSILFPVKLQLSDSLLAYVKLWTYLGMGHYPALQIRAGQWAITANLWPLTAHIYHVMIIVTSAFSKKSFYYYYFYFV